MGYVVNTSLWGDSTIPYVVDPEIQAYFTSAAFRAANPGVVVESDRMINEAVAAWNVAAPIKLRPRQGESHYLNIKRGPKGNGGHAGATNYGEAVITFDFEWSLGATWRVAVRAMMHEIGHIAGLIHEHQRPDRDTYIGFNRSTANDDDRKIINSGTIVGNYDCVSIMHYVPQGNPPDIFSRPGGCPQFGDLSDTRLSPGDLVSLQHLYPPLLAITMRPAGVLNRTAAYTFRVTRADLGTPVAGVQLKLHNGNGQQLIFFTDRRGNASQSLALRYLRKITVVDRHREVELFPPTLEASKAGFTTSSIDLLAV